jgi:hypothetical protein
LEQKEERCEAKQDDQDQPSAKQPVWNITDTVEGNHRQKNDQGDAPTFNQPVAVIAFEHTPEEKSVRDENQEATDNGAKVVGIRRDHHAENASACFWAYCRLRTGSRQIVHGTPNATSPNAATLHESS